MSLVHNERAKLSANLLNTIAAALAVAGVVAPLVELSNAIGTAVPTVRLIFIALEAATRIITAAALHFAARRVLGSLKP